MFSSVAAAADGFVLLNLFAIEKTYLGQCLLFVDQKDSSPQCYMWDMWKDSSKNLSLYKSF